MSHAIPFTFLSRVMILIAVMSFGMIPAERFYAATSTKSVNASAVAGTYNVLIPDLEGITYGGSPIGYGVTLKVAKSGKITGTWTTSLDGLTVTGSVTVKGQVSKVTKGKFSTKGSFTLTLSNKVTGKGTLTGFTGGSAAIQGTLKSGATKVTFAGSKSL